MRFRLLFLNAALLGTLSFCKPTQVVPPAAPLAPNLTGSLGIAGDPADATGPTTGGTVLMGGSTDVDEAIRWMVAKAGGGDFVVLRASGTAAYNTYVFSELGGVNSCETLLINSRALANAPEVEARVRAAEAVFIAGGDQANYVNFWKGTKLEDALNYLRNTKQVPIGGTSAGCAIQGRTYFSALNGTITSAEALANPYNSLLTLGRNDFLNTPYLADVVTDTHFNNPDRSGRLVAFLARLSQDFGVVGRGIGVEEATAVCIGADGTGKVFGRGRAFFLSQNGSANAPETCVSGTRLHWNRGRQAVRVYQIAGTPAGTGTFDLNAWGNGTGGTSKYFYVDQGTLGSSN
ncbi:cyanophycinase [Hymenobacter antarcticus]|uniref:Cyanophycinase n=1 Tax=Hymenobacter antarcticus TaxID=486270 RepID=A0ABP7PF74_9BACT